MLNEKIEIRRARKEDCAAIMQLIQELAVYEKAPDAVTVSAAHFEESGFCEKPVWWAFVAEVTHADGVQNVVAFALYYIRYSTWKGQRMYLEDIVVTEAYRGKGIGSLLMTRLITEMHDKNFSGMLWQVLDWNTPAINFYNKYNAHFDSDWINVSLERP